MFKFAISTITCSLATSWFNMLLVLYYCEAQLHKLLTHYMYLEIESWNQSFPEKQTHMYIHPDMCIHNYTSCFDITVCIHLLVFPVSLLFLCTFLLLFPESLTSLAVLSHRLLLLQADIEWRQRIERKITCTCIYIPTCMPLHYSIVQLATHTFTLQCSYS